MLTLCLARPGRMLFIQITIQITPGRRGRRRHHAQMLLDSSVFIRWARQRKNLASALEPHLQRGSLMTCGTVRVEVLRGARYPAARAELQTIFNAMNEIATSGSVWERTANLAWTLDRRGQVLPLPDILIAACALEVNVPLVTFDGHFAAVPGLTVYSDLP